MYLLVDFSLVPSGTRTGTARRRCPTRWHSDEVAEMVRIDDGPGGSLSFTPIGHLIGQIDHPPRIIVPNRIDGFDAGFDHRRRNRREMIHRKVIADGLPKIDHPIDNGLSHPHSPHGTHQDTSGVKWRISTG